MILAWLQHGILCTTDDIQNVPEEYRSKVVKFPHLSWPKDSERLTVSNGIIKEKSEEDIRKEKIQETLQRIRTERNLRLEKSDWVVIRYVELGKPVPKEWVEYRQMLRDLPQLLTEDQILSGNIKWPKPPDNF